MQQTHSGCSDGGHTVRLIHTGPSEYGWKALDAQTGECLITAVSETMLRFECKLRGWLVEVGSSGSGSA